ncbi:MAG: hypothetical protein CMH15_05320 [Mesonia sp.]|uniref:Uncharacterized protein n=1 Tax=Mesonia oceanica TaxID=2687242 RepID=A0AC61Y7C7_9FLAO|nr:hypothetical protein [Mesonia sp.]MAQ40465.1 hypothetical protein [Mesonia sp.]MBJ98086.1 hypothetical protein [Flavobacteriaceae bacterium]VVV00303.1 hypothetical protein FVB9532_01572 [Mesonia oceanica]
MGQRKFIRERNFESPCGKESLFYNVYLDPEGTTYHIQMMKRIKMINTLTKSYHVIVVLMFSITINHQNINQHQGTFSFL